MSKVTVMYDVMIFLALYFVIAIVTGRLLYKFGPEDGGYDDREVIIAVGCLWPMTWLTLLVIGIGKFMGWIMTAGVKKRGR